jgi:ATP-dependent DNA ligase
VRSRNNNDFNARYPAVVEALAKLPENTVIDGEVVAFDQEGRPSFNALQNYGTAPGPVVYYVFDVMVLAGQNRDARATCRSAESCSRRRYWANFRNRSATPPLLMPSFRCSFSP